MKKQVALSVRQPWAWAIVSGYKDVENRTWKTNYRGDLWIHAGLKKATKEDIDFVIRTSASWSGESVRELHDRYLREVKYGGIVGTAFLMNCRIVHQYPRSPWEFGPMVWELDHQQSEMCKFMPCKGALGLFRPSETG